MIELTPQQRQALRQNGEPLRLFDPDTQQTYVLIESELYRQLKEDQEDRIIQKAWLNASHQSAIAWMKENPY